MFYLLGLLLCDLSFGGCLPLHKTQIDSAHSRTRLIWPYCTSRVLSWVVAIPSAAAMTTLEPILPPPSLSACTYAWTFLSTHQAIMGIFLVLALSWWLVRYLHIFEHLRQWGTSSWTIKWCCLQCYAYGQLSIPIFSSILSDYSSVFWAERTFFLFLHRWTFAYLLLFLHTFRCFVSLLDHVFWQSSVSAVGSMFPGLKN